MILKALARKIMELRESSVYRRQKARRAKRRQEERQGYLDTYYRKSKETGEEEVDFADQLADKVADKVLTFLNKRLTSDLVVTQGAVAAKETEIKLKKRQGVKLEASPLRVKTADDTEGLQSEEIKTEIENNALEELEALMLGDE